MGWRRGEKVKKEVKILLVFSFKSLRKEGVGWGGRWSVEKEIYAHVMLMARSRCNLKDEMRGEKRPRRRRKTQVEGSM